MLSIRHSGESNHEVIRSDVFNRRRHSIPWQCRWVRMIRVALPSFLCRRCYRYDKEKQNGSRLTQYRAVFLQDLLDPTGISYHLLLLSSH